MTDSKFVWIFAASFGLGLLSAPSARAQLSFNHREPDAFGLFAVEQKTKEAVLLQNLKFDFRVISTPIDRPQLVSDHRFGSSLLAGFDQGLVEDALEPPDAWQFAPGESLRIPEPATFGLLGILMLLGLMALHRVRHKSAILAV